MSNEIIYNQDGNLIDDVSNIIESSQKYAYHIVDSVLVLRNWLLGKRIANENMGGSGSERYGTEIIAKLSNCLTEKYGKGFDKSSLYRYVKFYQRFPEIVATVSPQSIGADRGEFIETGTITFDIKIKHTDYNKDSLNKRNSNIEEFFDVIDW